VRHSCAGAMSEHVTGMRPRRNRQQAGDGARVIDRYGHRR
jgi:hypothetical protein